MAIQDVHMACLVGECINPSATETTELWSKRSARNCDLEGYPCQKVSTLHCHYYVSSCLSFFCNKG